MTQAVIKIELKNAITQWENVKEILIIRVNHTKDKQPRFKDN